MFQSSCQHLSLSLDEAACSSFMDGADLSSSHAVGHCPTGEYSSSPRSPLLPPAASLKLLRV